MSFLRNIRNNLTNSGHNSQRNGKPKPVAPAPRSTIGERNTNSNGSRIGSNDHHRTAGSESERERSGYGTYRRNSGGGTSRRGSSSTTLRREEKYGKENPAPIIVFVNKYDTVKKPAGILRKNTFTKGDREQERQAGNAISRSDTFTINELENEEKAKTSTYTKKKKSKDKSPEKAPELPYSKNVEFDSTEKLPVVFDSSTYRKKSLKSSKPVQKVESFIKRFEKSLFKHDSKKNGRKDSNASESTYVPKFRDVGINCKLDEEDKLKAKKERQRSRDSLLEIANMDHSSSSQRSYRERSTTPLQKHRARSTSPTKKYATFDRKEPHYERDESPVVPERPRRGRDRTPSPFETLELKSKQADKSYLKARQKEIEMGYSTVNKKPTTLTRARSPDRNKSILVNATRTERFDPERGRSYTVTTSTHRVEFDRPPPFRSDTYSSLKEEYEQANRKPVGIASPRLNSDRPKHEPSTSPSKQNRKDSAELPKYTFGAELQERRSRFQEFQKSFNNLDEKTAEVTYQQSFFVPI